MSVWNQFENQQGMTKFRFNSDHSATESECKTAVFYPLQQIHEVWNYQSFMDLDISFICFKCWYKLIQTAEIKGASARICS